MEVVCAAQTLCPDVIVSDLTMPLLNGLQAMKRLHDAGHPVPFVLVTADARDARGWLAMGVSGVVDKCDMELDLLPAVRAAGSGRSHLSTCGWWFGSKTRNANTTPAQIAARLQRKRVTMGRMAPRYFTPEEANRALAGVRPSIADPACYASVNIDGLVSVLDAARGSGCRTVAFASSSSVYGNNRKVPFA